MAVKFSERIVNTPRSFIREILKVTENPEVISFAGGLPNPESFPVEEIAKCSEKVLMQQGAKALQYATTEGERSLREYIADRYRTKHGLNVSADNIIITTGSQQGLDLLGKTLIDKGDPIIIERPGYLGAIQAMSMFQADFLPINLNNDGVDIVALDNILATNSPKFFYAVTNFNNPKGITYSLENKKQIAQRLQDRDMLFIEDNPYGELRFLGEDVPLMKSLLYDNTVLLGSFSKIVAPAMRLGWVCASEGIIEKLTVAAQASCLHTNSFVQKVAAQYLQDYDLDKHIAKIRELYGRKRNLMVSELEKNLPLEVEFTRPDGGMFLWVTLPEGVSALEVFNVASKQNVVFVPGDPFYVGETGVNTMRLNYTNSSDSQIINGIKLLSSAIKQVLDRK